MGRPGERSPKPEFWRDRVARRAASSVGPNVFVRVCVFVGLVQLECVALAVVAKNSGIATPIQGRLDLPHNIRFSEVLIEDVVKEFERHHMVRLAIERRLHSLEQGYMAERRLTEERFTGGDVGLGKCHSL